MQHRFRCFVSVNLRNSHNNPIKYDYHPYFTTENTDVMVNLLVITQISISGFDLPFKKNVHWVSTLVPGPCASGQVTPAPGLILGVPLARSANHSAALLARWCMKPRGSLLPGSRTGRLAPKGGPKGKMSSRSCHALLIFTR